LYINNKNTSLVADGEGQNMGAMIPRERNERGLRGSRGAKVNNNILLFSPNPLSHFILSPLSYILS
jgi:hypothetical protein